MRVIDEQTVTEQLLEILLSQRRIWEKKEASCRGSLCPDCTRHPRKIINRTLKDKIPLSLILPAFPAKSSNRQKTISEKPDLGEVMGLNNLNQWCQSLSEVYEPGVKLIICSDGRVFNDLVLVSDAEVDVYQKGIKQIIEEDGLHHITTFSLDEVYPYREYPAMRELLMLEYGQSLDVLKNQISKNEQHRYQFNGIHRFVVEDQLALKPLQSKNKIRNEAKCTAYEVIRRSNAWSRLLADYFPLSVRLSIHPQACGSEKIGVQFLPATNRWATPWHNVLLKDTCGWRLMKRYEAEQLGAVLNQDHYVLEAC